MFNVYLYAVSLHYQNTLAEKFQLRIIVCWLINGLLGVFAESPIRAPLLTLFTSHTKAGVCGDSDGGVSHETVAAENVSCPTDTTTLTHSVAHYRTELILRKTKGIRFMDVVFLQTLFCSHEKRIQLQQVHQFKQGNKNHFYYSVNVANHVTVVGIITCLFVI